MPLVPNDLIEDTCFERPRPLFRLPGGTLQFTSQLSGHVEGLYAEVEVYVHSEAINDCK